MTTLVLNFDVDEGSGDFDNGECGCTCLTAEEKQRWLDTMDAYEKKLAGDFIIAKLYFPSLITYLLSYPLPT